MKRVDICVFVNTTPFKVTKFLERKKKQVTFNSLQKDNHIPCFTSLSSLLKHKPTSTSILWESIPVVAELKQEIKVRVLDANIHRNGIAKLLPPNYNLLLQCIETPNSDLDLIFEPFGNKMLSRNTKVSKKITEFLDTIPVIIHIPFIVVLCKTIRNNDPEIMEKFLELNRIITSNVNKKSFIEVMELSNKKSINYLISRYANHDLTRYLDEEETIQPYL